jgi:hypothetical protein
MPQDKPRFQDDPFSAKEVAVENQTTDLFNIHLT